MTEQVFEGQHAVVTGGGTGIGAAIARNLAARGARVTLMARNLERLEARAAELEQAQAVAVDVTDEAAVTAAFVAATETFGPAQILVNNAGLAEATPFHKLSVTEWRRTLDINLTGAYLCMREVVGPMRDAGYGRIITVASTAGLVGYPYVTHYTAAKHGVIGLTRALALELATKGVTVNAVCPGYTETDIVKEAIDNIVAKTGRTADEAMAELTARNPQKRLIQPEEVASAVVWLALKESGSITGQSIAVAGGEVT